MRIIKAAMARLFSEARSYSSTAAKENALIMMAERTTDTDIPTRKTYAQTRSMMSSSRKNVKRPLGKSEERRK